MIDVFSTRFQMQTAAQMNELISVRPSPVVCLETLAPALAADRLSEALKDIFIPSQFSIEFIKESIERAQQFSAEHFASDANYLLRLYNPPDVESFPICLTGLAGVGKSQTIKALRKLMPGPSSYICDHYQAPHTLISYWYASARGKAAGKQLLADFLGGDALEARPNASKLLVECRRRASRDGISLVLLEEMQHLNTGQGVARVTDILLTMAGLGVPMIYVANYSLLHKLLSRNSEDKQRLLSEPRVMLPDAPGSKAWNEYIQECIRVSGGRVSADPIALANELYRCTFGIKRLAVQMLKAAYLEARVQGRHMLGLQDVTTAYLSTSYSSNRDDVEELFRQDLQRRKTGPRSDLRCPFTIPAQSNVVQFARQDRDTRLNEKAFQSALTATERKSYDELHPPGTASNPLIKPKREKKSPLLKRTREGLEDAYSRLLGDKTGPLKPAGPKK